MIALSIPVAASNRQSRLYFGICAIVNSEGDICQNAGTTKIDLIAVVSLPPLCLDRS